MFEDSATIAPDQAHSGWEDLLGPTLAIDLPIRVTRFPDAAARTKSERLMSLRQLAEMIKQNVAPSKAQLPLYKLAGFGGQKTEKGCLRHNANVETITGVEADFDKGAISPSEAEQRLRRYNIAALVCTTTSHGKDNTSSWRVFAPFDCALSPDERDQHMQRLNGVFDGLLDGASFTLSQSYHAGSVVGAAPLDIRLVDGRAINRADDLDAIALPKGKRRQEEGEAFGSDASGSGELYSVACRIKREGGSIEDFRAAIASHDRAAAHVTKEDKAGKGRGDRAINRAWQKAPAPMEFPDMGEEAHTEPPTSDKKPRLTLLSPDECTQAPSRGYIWKGMLAPGDVACIFGAPGSGKSLIAPLISYAVARGDQAFGLRTKQGGVLYVAAEDPKGMQGRVSVLRQRLGSAEAFRLVTNLSDLTTKDSPDLVALLQVVGERKPALVVIDTLARAFPGLEENSSEAMGRVITVTRRIARTGAAVILIHHGVKSEGARPTPRGHGSLDGDQDMTMHVVKEDGGIVRASLIKNRNGESDRVFAFRIGVADCGADEDGDPITFAFAEEIGAVPKRARLNKSEGAALAILRDIIGHVPDKLGFVLEADWRNAMQESRLVCGSDNIESRRKAISRAIRGLEQKGRIAIKADLVSVADDRQSTDEMFNDVEDDGFDV